MTVYLLRRSDGNVTVAPLYGELPIETVIAKWELAHPGVTVEGADEIQPSQIPTDRSFREAWRPCSKNGVRHCLDTAKAIHKDRIRQRRKERFQETDVAGVQGLVNRRDVSDVLAMVQALKDAPADPRIEQAGSVEELKAIWPEVLEQPVPALGGPVVQGQEGTYDLKGLENWAQGLNEKIARLEAANAQKFERDLQQVAQAYVGIEGQLSALNQRLNKSETDIDWLNKNTATAGSLALTKTETVQ